MSFYSNASILIGLLHLSLGNLYFFTLLLKVNLRLIFVFCFIIFNFLHPFFQSLTAMLQRDFLLDLLMTMTSTNGRLSFTAHQTQSCMYMLYKSCQQRQKCQASTHRINSSQELKQMPNTNSLSSSQLNFYMIS